MLIAQLTDIHIKPQGKLVLGKLDTTELLRRAVDRVNGLPKRPDLVVLTGDITDTGTADECVRARAELDRLEIPYLAIPGNHDERDTFRNAFADLGFLEEGAFVQYSKNVGALTFVALDSTVAGITTPNSARCARNG